MSISTDSRVVNNVTVAYSTHQTGDVINVAVAGQPIADLRLNDDGVVIAVEHYWDGRGWRNVDITMVEMAADDAVRNYLSTVRD